MNTSRPKRGLSNKEFVVLAGLFCSLWAFIAWLAVIPNQDILADAVQVQSLFADPRVVLSFPGQKHGGPIEYPFQILAELLVPGNFYVHTFPRIIFAFLTGFFTAKLFLQLFPNARKWSFLTSIAIGPTIIHGLSGPEGNTVGVWWLVGNYDISWLLVVSGAFLLTKAVPENSRIKVLLAGLIVGLGFFAHPNVTILIIPLGILTLLILRPRLSQIVLLIASFVIGILPALFSYFFFSGNNTWDPSHPPFFVRDLYLNALGLNGIPDYISVVLPYALGLPPSQSFFSGSVQSGITWTVVLAVTITACVGWFQAAKHRKWPGYIVIISTSWLGAIFSIMLFVTFIDTVWFYATSLSILFWLSIGALPTSISPRWLALTICVVFLALEGISMLTHNWYFYSDLPNRIKEKAEYQNTIHKQAQNLLDNGVEIVYGSYLDVIPLAYASSFELRPISNRYNRFPLSQEAQLENYRTAILTNPQDNWGTDALQRATSECRLSSIVNTEILKYEIRICNGESISK